MSELLPCPFCGAEFGQVLGGSEHVPGLYVVCYPYRQPPGCGAATAFFHTTQEARDAWNRRARALPRPAEEVHAHALEDALSGLLDWSASYLSTDVRSAGLLAVFKVQTQGVSALPEGHPARVALELLDRIGDERCAEGTCGHEPEDGCAANDLDEPR